MCVYIYVCIYICIYICIYMYIYMCVCECAYVLYIINISVWSIGIFIPNMLELQHDFKEPKRTVDYQLWL